MIRAALTDRYGEPAVTLGPFALWTHRTWSYRDPPFLGSGIQHLLECTVCCEVEGGEAWIERGIDFSLGPLNEVAGLALQASTAINSVFMDFYGVGIAIDIEPREARWVQVTLGRDGDARDHNRQAHSFEFAVTPADLRTFAAQWGSLAETYGPRMKRTREPATLTVTEHARRQMAGGD